MSTYLSYFQIFVIYSNLERAVKSPFFQIIFPISPKSFRYIARVMKELKAQQLVFAEQFSHVNLSITEPSFFFLKNDILRFGGLSIVHTLLVRTVYLIWHEDILQHGLNCHYVPLPLQASLAEILAISFYLTLPGSADAKSAMLCCDTYATTFAFNMS